MIGRLCLWVGLCCVVGVAPGFGQDTPTPPPPLAPAPAAAVPAGTALPPGAQTASNLTPAMKDQINKYLQEQFTALTGMDPAAQGAARKALSGALPGSQSAFYAYFTQQWTSLATAALKQNASLNSRLNIAIITSALTNAAQSLDAEPLVRKLLDDREPAVVLWAIRASKPLISTVLVNVPNVGTSQLMPSIVGAVKRTGSADVIGGFIVQDAYRTLAIPAVGGNVPRAVAEAANTKIPGLVPSVLDILEYRISLHAQGLVPSPGAEREIGTWLSAEQYKKVSAATQTRIVQDLVTLATYVGERTALYQYNKTDMGAIREMLKYTISALDVIDQPPPTDLNWAPKLESNAAEILSHTKKIYPAVAANPAFKISAPPPIKVIEPPPPPTTPATPAASAGSTSGTTPPGR